MADHWAEEAPRYQSLEPPAIGCHRRRLEITADFSYGSALAGCVRSADVQSSAILWSAHAGSVLTRLMLDGPRPGEPIGFLASVAIFLRGAWLPAWAGLALAWLGIPEPVAVIASAPLLIAEVLNFRRRWTRRMLRGLVPADPTLIPGDSAGDVRQIARAYGAALVAFVGCVATWLAFDGVTLNLALGFAWITYGTAIAAAAYVGFEYLVRSRFGTRFRLVVLTRNNVRGLGDDALVFVLPRDLQLGASTVVGIGAGVLLSTMAMAFAVLTSDWERGPFDPRGIAVVLGMITMLQTITAMLWTMLESGLVAPTFNDKEMQRRLTIAEQARQKAAQPIP